MCTLYLKYKFLKNKRIKLLELKLEQKYQSGKEDGFRMCSKKEQDEKVFKTDIVVKKFKEI